MADIAQSERGRYVTEVKRYATRIYLKKVNTEQVEDFAVGEDTEHVFRIQTNSERFTVQEIQSRTDN